MGKNSGVQDKRVIELQDIYKEMDTDGKETLISAVDKLLHIQRTFKYPQETRKRHFRDITLYITLGLIIVCAIWFFWEIFINPALQKAGITPLIMVRIIATAFIGILCVFSGLAGFLLQRISVHWLLLLIITGIACLDPQIFTDIIGFSFLALIITVLLSHKKRHKATFSP